MARGSMGLRYAIHFRARHNGSSGSRNLALRNSGSGFSGSASAAVDHYPLGRLARTPKKESDRGAGCRTHRSEYRP
jgi:hypothetical protein